MFRINKIKNEWIQKRVKFTNEIRLKISISYFLIEKKETL